MHIPQHVWKKRNYQRVIPAFHQNQMFLPILKMLGQAKLNVPIPVPVRPTPTLWLREWTHSAVPSAWQIPSMRAPAIPTPPPVNPAGSSRRPATPPCQLSLGAVCLSIGGALGAGLQVGGSSCTCRRLQERKHGLLDWRSDFWALVNLGSLRTHSSVLFSPIYKFHEWLIDEVDCLSCTMKRTRH